ncbi:MAG: amidohydrolase, partial [Verrucomicrobiota bacterium]|nr:amidohydrolase [Verrucomicrobiota bacterium]
MKRITVMLLLFAAISLSAASPLQKTVQARVASEYGKLFELYKHLHSHPEISFQEAKTGLRMGQEMRALGFEVTQNIGGHGVVCVLKNGRGPTVLVRTDTDALPVPEATGLPYASKQKTIDDKGVEVPTMH